MLNKSVNHIITLATRKEYGNQFRRMHEIVRVTWSAADKCGPGSRYM